jgi:hypothetical protein
VDRLRDSLQRFGPPAVVGLLAVIAAIVLARPSRRGRGASS